MSSKNKELTLQETFYNICKDLTRYIDKKIVKKYVSPNPAQIPKDKKINENIHKDNKWRYFFEDEDTTEEERIKDIFKDNNFLFRLQKLNNELNAVIKNMDENKIQKEKLSEKLNKENEKMKLTNEMNNQLINYFMEKNMNLNLINQNDITKAIEDLKRYSLINNPNPDFFQLQYKDKINNETKEQKNNELKNNENSDNIKEIKEINIKSNDNNDKKEKVQSKDDRSIQNKIISNLIQAFDILNKNKKKKIKEEKINKLMENIFGEDASDDDEENEEFEEKEENEEDEVTKRHKMIINQNNKNKINEKKKEIKILNKKIKRNKK